MQIPYILDIEYTKKQNIIINPVKIKYGEKEIECMAMWDTGSQQTCISKHVLHSDIHL